MSGTLHWRQPSTGKAVGEWPLRDAVQAYLSMSAGREGELTQDDLSFLHGLAAANIEGADDLIQAVEKHERILVWIEH